MIRKLFRLILAISFIAALSQCTKGKDGPVGPQGEQGETGATGAIGPRGATGVTGNANAMEYTFQGNNFSINQQVILEITSPINGYAWFTYLVRSSENMYPIPGAGSNNTSVYRSYFSKYNDKTRAIIPKTSGPGEDYDAIKVIRIAVTSGVAITSQHPNINFKDYNAVKTAYKF